MPVPDNRLELSVELKIRDARLPPIDNPNLHTPQVSIADAPNGTPARPPPASFR